MRRIRYVRAPQFLHPHDLPHSHPPLLPPSQGNWGIFVVAAHLKTPSPSTTLRRRTGPSYYEEPLKLYVQAERIEANKVHRTPSLSLQLTGSRAQDLVPWARFTKCQSNCPVPECGHASTMPLQSREEIIAGDEHLQTAAEADDGDGVFQPMETKVGCYCFGQNCYGDEDGIGCWW